MISPAARGCNGYSSDVDGVCDGVDDGIARAMLAVALVDWLKLMTSRRR